MSVKDTQIVTLEIEQQYHEYTNNEFADLLFKLNSDNQYIKENTETIIKELKKQISIIDDTTKKQQEFQKLTSSILGILKSYRLDIRNVGNESNNIEVTDSANASVDDITWNIQQGRGKILQGYSLCDKFKIKTVNNGILCFDFRGQDKRFEGKIVPLWIDYKSIKIDGEDILSEPVATWHNKVYHYEMPVKDGQEITLEITQRYHLYSLREFENTISMFSLDNTECEAIYKVYIDIVRKNINTEKNDYASKKYCADYAWKIKNIDILDDINTIEKIKSEQLSIARFGDGEINFILNKLGLNFQKYNEALSNRLQETLKAQNERCLICIAGTYVKHDISDFWKKVVYNTKLELTPYLAPGYAYGETNITRHPQVFKEIKEIWQDKDIIIVEGELSRMGVGNDLFNNAKSIKRILCPAENAFDKYDEILNECKKQNKDKLFLIALGPTATVLAYDLANLGYWAMDVGHIDIVYEWKLRGGKEKIAIPGKYTNESKDGRSNIEDCTDPDYLNSIIAKITNVLPIENTKNGELLDNIVLKAIHDLSNYRVDIRNLGGETADVLAEGENISIKDITWNIQSGKGKVIESNSKYSKIKLKAIHSGNLRFEFKGPDKKYKDEKLPVCIDYKSIKINGNEILIKPAVAWHDEPCYYEIPVIDGQEIILEINQQYHEYFEDILKSVILNLNTDNKYVEENIDTIVKRISEQYIRNINILPEVRLRDIPDIVADLYIPIGLRCQPAQQLKEHNLRFCSLPYDWLGRCSLNFILDTIKQGVDNWLNKYMVDPLKASKYHFVYDMENHVRFRHAFPADKTIDEYMPEFKNIFGKRYDRMIKLISDAQTICFVSSERQDNVSDTYIFMKELESLYPNKKIYFVNITNSEAGYSVREYKMSNSSILFSIQGYNINEIGNEKTNSMFWTGNKKLWDKVCGHLSLSDNVKIKLEEENKNKDSAA